MAKNMSIVYGDTRINIVDTPGHADFGGEVERVLSMVDSVLLLVDAVEGPMPQTRFVTAKAMAQGLDPIVVINKMDRESARPDWAVEQTFELFDRLGATDKQLDFPVLYTSATEGWATTDLSERGSDMTALFQTIVDRVPPPVVDPAGPFRLRVSALDYSSYVGVIGIGRVERGRIRRNGAVTVVGADGEIRTGRMAQILGFHGLEKVEREVAEAGQIIAFTGMAGLQISDTVCDPAAVEPLPALVVDEPTMTMTFQVNDSPFAGQEGKFVTSRNLGERLAREAIHNVALRVEPTDDADKFKVAGRGELHLSILVETMRREGYELAISRPEVIVKQIDGEAHEPWESLTVDVPATHQGPVMEKLGQRRGELRDMVPDGKGRVRLDYLIPSRGLIGFRSEYLTTTSGNGLIYHTFDHYGPVAAGALGRRQNGVMVAKATGKVLAYALFNLQERGRMFVRPGERVYQGMVVGIHARSTDLVVNPLRAKQLTNIRAAGSDENILLTPPIQTTLEYALEFIDWDELVEVTPRSIRIRKKLLTEHERKRAGRAA